MVIMVISKEKVRMIVQWKKLRIKEACKLHGLPFDSCLQKENLDHIFSVAPAEGNKPLQLLVMNCLRS